MDVLAAWKSRLNGYNIAFPGGLSRVAYKVGFWGGEMLGKC
jgi:hypothetical protein